VVVGFVIVTACAIIAALSRVTNFEEALFHLINSLPTWLYRFFWLVMQLGTYGAIFVMAGVALLTRRVRLALELLAAGLVAYYASLGLKDLVNRARPAELISGVVVRGQPAQGLGFPSGHAAVSAALAATAVPFLARRWRRWIWLLPLTVGIARIFVGAHLPLDVVGGFVLGWTVGALVHLIGGSPSGRVSRTQVRDALERSGQQVVDVREANVDARGSTPFFVDTAEGGGLFVKAVGADQRDADLLFKLWRFLAYRNLDDERPFTSAKRQLQVEALVDLLAAKFGLRTPDVVALATLEDGTTLLAFRGLDAKSLDSIDVNQVSDDVLEGLWSQVALLRAARIAHRDLRLANVMIDVEGNPWVIDFGFAQTSATDRALARDIAEMLASQSTVVDPDRVVTTALVQLGPTPIAEALPFLTMSSLARATRTGLKRAPGTLERLRNVAASRLEETAPRPVRVTRWRPAPRR
jgi:undecaprenyl-diphosphatase